jgi:hypothetical protein
MEEEQGKLGLDRPCQGDDILVISEFYGIPLTERVKWGYITISL